ncbi:MAG: DUF4198 domain-containing protein [Methanosarcinaceae archaeon]
MIEKNMPDIVRGHEIWLEHDMQHVHAKETIECKLLFGHNMAIDGLAEIKNVKASVFDPVNGKHDFAVDPGNNYLVVRFDPVLDGYHTVAVEYDAGIYTVTDEGWHKGPKSDYENVKNSGYYYQYAKTIISGHGSKDLNPVIGHELEVVPVDFRHYHAGEEIELKVLYDSATLAKSVITAVCSGNEDDPVEVTTDSDGIALIKLDRSGNWMFKVGHADPGKGVKDQYDEKVITAVLTVMGVH